MVITSYEIVMADAQHLKFWEWGYVVVDEGHRLKNSSCRLLRELGTLPQENKLLLTGDRLASQHFLEPSAYLEFWQLDSWLEDSSGCHLPHRLGALLPENKLLLAGLA